MPIVPTMTVRLLGMPLKLRSYRPMFSSAFLPHSLFRLRANIRCLVPLPLANMTPLLPDVDMAVWPQNRRAQVGPPLHDMVLPVPRFPSWESNGPSAEEMQLPQLMMLFSLSSLIPRVESSFRLAEMVALDGRPRHV